MARLKARLTGGPAFPRPAYPAGHPHSPEVDRAELERNAARIWSSDARAIGVDFNDESHLHVLTNVFPKYIDEFQYPTSLAHGRHSEHEFTEANSQFSGLDARLLFVVMRSLGPGRIISAGSNQSALLMADVNRRFFDSGIQITCIDPSPGEALRNGLSGITHLISAPVAEVPMSTFAELQANDILFIDSSHVSKTGSDVNFLFLEVLPRLAKGVFVHIHDIFLPQEYPRSWLMDDGRSWNEQYLLQALLVFSAGFRVRFGSNYAYKEHSASLVAALKQPPGAATTGSSFWIEKIAENPSKPLAIEPESVAAVREVQSLRVQSASNLNEYTEHIDVMRPELTRRWQMELELAKQPMPLQTPGWCFPCGTATAFETDLIASSAIIDGTQVPNWRERVLCPICQMNGRTRAAIQLLGDVIGATPESSIYLTEQVTPLFRALSTRYPRLVGSEYFGDGIPFGSLDTAGVRNESLTGLTFENNSFDFVLSFDVLEHIPEYGLALKEIGRCLKPGGRLLLSVPFVVNQQETRIRARLGTNGNIEHLLEPQYHGDPVNEQGCLCFQDFGWDLLDQLRSIGFSKAEMLLYWSDHFGYYGVEQSLIVAQKSPA